MACEKHLRICAARDTDPGNFFAVVRHLEAAHATELGMVASARNQFSALTGAFGKVQAKLSGISDGVVI